MGYTVVKLVPQPADTPNRLRAAQHVAVTGHPVLGFPAQAAKEFSLVDQPIVLLAVSEGRPLGVVSWSTPGPSNRIVSGRVESIAVHNSVASEYVPMVGEFLLHCVPLQFAAAIGIGAGGYIVADVPLTNPIGEAFVRAGWEPIQSAQDATATRYVFFLEYNYDAGQSQSDEYNV